MGKDNKRKDGVYMVASKGVILSVKGKTAKKLLAQLENPKTNEKVVRDCTVVAKQLKETRIAPARGVSQTKVKSKSVGRVRSK